MNQNEMIVEDTGGGCQWLRVGNVAVTDGHGGLPNLSEPCEVITLEENGEVDQSMAPMPFPSLGAAMAFINAPAYI